MITNYRFNVFKKKHKNKINQIIFDKSKIGLFIAIIDYKHCRVRV